MTAPMDERPPGGLPGRAGLLDRAFAMLRQLSMLNILVLGLLAVIAVPSYFAWKFMTEPEFRREFRSRVQLIDAGVPCLVMVGNVMGDGDRTTIAVGYDVRDRFEHLVAVRSPTPLSSDQIAVGCKTVQADVALMKAALRQAEHHARPPEP